MQKAIRRLFRRDNILVLLLIAGAFLGVVGVPQNYGISTEQILLALLGILAIDTLLERVGYLDRMEQQLIALDQKIDPRPSSDSMFRSRVALPPFTDEIANAEEVWMLGKSLRATVTSHGRQILQEAEKGTKFRFLLPNPDNRTVLDSIVSTSFSSTDSDRAEAVIRETIEHLRRIEKTAPVHAIEVRLADFVPPYAYTIVNGRRPHGYMILEFFGYKISAGERTHLYLTREIDQRVFAAQIEQYERMWNDSLPLADQ